MSAQDKDTKARLEALRSEMSAVNQQLLEGLNRFIDIANQIGEAKEQLGLPYFDPAREGEMLQELQQVNRGPLSSDQLKRVFKELFQVSVDEMQVEGRKKLMVNRLPGAADAVIQVGGAAIGGPRKVLMAGPCSVENRDQMMATAKRLSELGVQVLRGGAFKPRTSPYSFQGLEEEGLKIMREAADAYGMAMITEVMNVRDVDLVARYTDILQVGTRNMFNYSLLKELGKVDKPVFLKRGFCAKIDEFILAAEYVYLGGNKQVMFCERGIRTFETQTRNTLDLSAVPILKQETTLPVIVDVSHALGRKDILKPMAHAALAAGADGLMVEAHYSPAVALSDCAQQLDPDGMDDFFQFINGVLERL
jgi:3-deoxy-7-phosphoheptulonate synthase/chorismate mutase